MKERPIIFNGEMVRAVLDGRKTQTRRVINPQPKGLKVFEHIDGGGRFLDIIDWDKTCRYGQSGDHLWVRETFYYDDLPWADGGSLKEQPDPFDPLSMYYRADGECCQQIPECCCDEVGRTPWRPSIHMPRWASRINLEVTGVRVERVRDIKREEALLEGCTADDLKTHLGVLTGLSAAITRFRQLWDSINEKRGFGWSADPWVWVVDFKLADTLERSSIREES